jgi:predicted RNase H-like HicB family nuclease
VTEGDSLEQAYANVSDALAAVIELYEEEGARSPAVSQRIRNGTINRTSEATPPGGD